MPEDTTRKFGLWDAMVLVAATAVGLAVFPHAFGDLSTYAIRLLKLVSNLSAPQRDWRDGTVSIYYIFAQFAGLLLPFCSAWSLALILLRLRKPRPALRQIAVQPGEVACGSALLATVFFSILVGFILVIGPPALLEPDTDSWALHRTLLILVGPPLIGFTVLGAWSTLLLGGHFRTEPSWMDRAAPARDILDRCDVPSAVGNRGDARLPVSAVTVRGRHRARQVGVSGRRDTILEFRPLAVGAMVFGNGSISTCCRTRHAPAHHSSRKPPTTDVLF